MSSAYWDVCVAARSRSKARLATHAPRTRAQSAIEAVIIVASSVRSHEWITGIEVSLHVEPERPRW